MTRTQALQKAKDLVSQMTLEEKASQLRYDAPAIKRLGVPTYNWWNEALHGVARAGCATSFPQSIALSAMFDPDFMTEIGDIIATEGRAKYNVFSAEEDRDIYKGLTFWSPNINIFRDPRWGRGHETYGEDPYLTGTLGNAFINGLQGDGEIMKSAACAKHYAVHSGPEDLRHEFNAVVSDKDLWETYLPAFETAVKDAKVESVMGAYNRTNDEPCCGSFFLIRDILREKWGFEGHFVSDCWAIRDFHTDHGITKTAEESAARAIQAGCDVNCGNTYLHLLQAVEEGLITEADITQSAERLFTTRFLLGLFDGSEYDSIPYEVVECKEHLKASKKAGDKSIVLLKNDGILPLDKSALKTIGVVGPNADSRLALIGNYHGTSSSYTTVLEGIQGYVGDDCRVLYAEGSHMYKKKVEPLAWDQDRISEAVIVAKHSDVVVCCLGLNELMEGEEMDDSNAVGSGDKADLKLPAVQQELLEKVTAVGKPVILLVMTGSAMDLNFADAQAAAVMQVWYPGAEGGKSVADLLFGAVSPSGKLPITIYKNCDNLPAFTDYSMVGRTYRFIEEEALYPFGFGLSYGDVTVADACVVADGDDYKVTATLKNDGMATDEVVQVYIKDLQSKDAVKNHSLCGYKRVSVANDATVTVEIPVAGKALLAVNQQGQAVLDSKQFALYVGLSQPDDRSVSLMGKAPIALSIEL